MCYGFCVCQWLAFAYTLRFVCVCDHVLHPKKTHIEREKERIKAESNQDEILWLTEWCRVILTASYKPIAVRTFPVFWVTSFLKKKHSTLYFNRLNISTEIALNRNLFDSYNAWHWRIEAIMICCSDLTQTLGVRV